MIDHILGFILGMFFYSILWKLYNDVYISYLKLSKTLDPFINAPISSYKFIERKNDMVKIELAENSYLILLLDKQNVNVFINNDLIIYKNDDINKQKMDYFYKKLTEGFHNEIFVNIININGITISQNLIADQDMDGMLSEEESIKTKNIYVPTIDEILDKISSLGMNSLTQEELKILRDNS